MVSQEAGGGQMAAVFDQRFDVSARKFHQAMCVALVAMAFVVGLPAAPWLVALVGAVLLLGRFWWPADIFRQFAWRVLEPSGVLPRREAVEDHETRRFARVLGGGALIASAGLLWPGLDWVWVVVGAVAAMIFLDAAFDY
ncbi:MAG: DUF4395 family protein [Chloroflexi bacterium]|nr:DUF4395 family protein [Chloroflexota bacterium]